jgi:peptide/nickel transport system permease protein
MVVLLFASTIFIFTLSRASGDPRAMYMSENISGREAWEALGREMGLDKPMPVQYLIWLRDLLHGDFGTSLQHQRDAMDLVRERLPATMQLAAGAFVFTVLLGVPLGVLSAVKRGTPWDYAGRTFALLGQAMPGFWLGIILIIIFAVQLGWLPTGRRGGLDHYILPCITLGWFTAAGLLRLVRSSMLEALDQQYIILARAKGVGSWSLVWKHAFKNASIGPLTFAGLLLGAFLTGTVVTEQVFAWPGIGRLAITAVLNNDFPVMAAVMLFTTVIYVATSLAIDLLYAYIDPRIRYK